MFGYHGKYLRIDLTSRSWQWIAIDPDVLRHFIGGVGLGTYLLLSENPPGVDPFSGEACLVYCFSPLVGTPLTTSAKFAVVAKSPLTFRLNDALSSSRFALEGKKTGADAIVITGEAPRPMLLVIDDGEPAFYDASHLWGLAASETETHIAERFGAEYATAAIGRAGENRVRFATISHGNRHAGRGGLGAVMGAKRLKAIAVHGSQRTPVADPKQVLDLAKEYSRRSFGPATEKYRELGTVSNLLTFNRLAALPTRNFRQGTFELAEAISAEHLNSARRMARNSCAACTIGCEHIYRSKDGPVRLEYESLFALGSLCGIGDSETVLQAARLCDTLGMDTISAGATIAFAMECCERGWLQADLRFGNGQALLEALYDVAERRGIGDRLAEGSRRLAESIGPEATDLAPHVKGLELPGYEPRAMQTMALGLAVGTRGADHNRSGAYEADFSTNTNRFHGDERSARLAVETEDRAAIIDSLILCKFLRGVFADFYGECADLLAAVTGWNVTSRELRTAAARIVNLKKLFNIREGWTADEDTLPKRFLREPLDLGGGKSASLPESRLREMITAYYQARGWDAVGRPSSATLEALGLDGLAKFTMPVPIAK